MSALDVLRLNLRTILLALLGSAAVHTNEAALVEDEEVMLLNRNIVVNQVGRKPGQSSQRHLIFRSSLVNMVLKSRAGLHQLYGQNLASRSPIVTIAT